MRAFTVHLDDELTVGTPHLSILPFVEVEKYNFKGEDKYGLDLGYFYKNDYNGHDTLTPYYFNVDRIHQDSQHDFANMLEWINVSCLRDKFLVGREVDKWTSVDNEIALVYVPSHDPEQNLMFNDFHEFNNEGSVVYAKTRSPQGENTHSYVIFLAEGKRAKINFAYNGERHTYELTYDDNALKVTNYTVTSDSVPYTGPDSRGSTVASPKSFGEYRKQKAAETKEYNKVRDTSPLAKFIRN